MASVHSNSKDGITEPCGNCNETTSHEVSLELRVESAKKENSQFSREPYRVTICRACGHESVTRMNDA